MSSNDTINVGRRGGLKILKAENDSFSEIVDLLSFQDVESKVSAAFLAIPDV